MSEEKCEFYINKAKEVIKMIDVRLNPDNQANQSDFLDNVSEAFLFNQSVDCLLDDAVKQLQTAKEENEKLNKRLERYKKQSDMLLARNKELSEILINNKAIRNKNAEIDNLTQQNKQMREALEEIAEETGTPYSTIAQQALKGVK